MNVPGTTVGIALGSGIMLAMKTNPNSWNSKQAFNKVILFLLGDEFDPFYPSFKHHLITIKNGGFIGLELFASMLEQQSRKRDSVRRQLKFIFKGPIQEKTMDYGRVTRAACKLRS